MLSLFLDDVKPKKRSKQNILAEQSDEIDRLRKENEIERTEKDNVRSAYERLVISINKEVQDRETLTEELRREKTKNDAHIKGLKQELDNNKITNIKLRLNNDKLKLELDKEINDNTSLQAITNKLAQEVNTYQTTIRILEDSVEKLRRELEATQTGKSNGKQSAIVKALVFTFIRLQ